MFPRFLDKQFSKLRFIEQFALLRAKSRLRRLRSVQACGPSGAGAPMALPPGELARRKPGLRGKIAAVNPLRPVCALGTSPKGGGKRCGANLKDKLKLAQQLLSSCVNGWRLPPYCARIVSGDSPSNCNSAHSSSVFCFFSSGGRTKGLQTTSQRLMGVPRAWNFSS